jgi:hypothetical protein
MLFQVMKIKLLLILLASNFAIVDSHIGKNCSLELPPPGFHYQLEGCPSTVNMEAPNLCMVPNSRCTLGCPGLCDEDQASLEYCIISFTCIWRLIPNNDNPKTSTPSPNESGLTEVSLISIIVSVVIVALVLIMVLIWVFVLKKRYGRLTNENLNVTYKVDEEICFNMSRSLSSLVPPESNDQ